MAHRPAYGNPPVAVLPMLQIEPAQAPASSSQGQEQQSQDQPPGAGALLVTVGAMIAVGRNEFSWRTVRMAPGALPGLLERYAQDPEGTLTEVFGYDQAATSFQSTGSQSARKTADEMGL